MDSEVEQILELCEKYNTTLSSLLRMESDISDFFRKYGIDIDYISLASPFGEAGDYALKSLGEYEVDHMVKFIKAQDALADEFGERITDHDIIVAKIKEMEQKSGT